MKIVKQEKKRSILNHDRLSVKGVPFIGAAVYLCYLHFRANPNALPPLPELALIFVLMMIGGALLRR